MLKKIASSPAELTELERRIDELRVHTHGTPMIAIDRWLNNSRSALRARVLPEQPAPDTPSGNLACSRAVPCGCHLEKSKQCFSCR